HPTTASRALTQTLSAIKAPAGFSAVEKYTDKTPAPSSQKRSTTAGVLSREETAIFDRELLQVFTDLALTSLNKVELTTQLQKLNARGKAGLMTIFAALKRLPSSREQAPLRIAQIDYVTYRMKWDPNAVLLATAFISSPLPSQASA